MKYLIVIGAVVGAFVLFVIGNSISNPRSQQPLTYEQVKSACVDNEPYDVDGCMMRETVKLAEKAAKSREDATDAELRH